MEVTGNTVQSQNSAPGFISQFSSETLPAGGSLRTAENLSRVIKWVRPQLESFDTGYYCNCHKNHSSFKKVCLIICTCTVAYTIFTVCRKGFVNS